MLCYTFILTTASTISMKWNLYVKHYKYCFVWMSTGLSQTLFWGWHSSASQGNWIPTFQRYVVPSSSRVGKSRTWSTFKTSESNYPVMQHHIPEKLNPQLFQCRDFRPHEYHLVETKHDTHTKSQVQKRSQSSVWKWKCIWDAELQIFICIKYQ